MIDFRFHLISVVAVFLALGLGILTGSGFIGDRLVTSLEDQVDRVRALNEERLEQVRGLEDRLDESYRFAAAVQPLLIDEALQDRQVVMITAEGADPGTIDGLRGAIEEAQGSVATAIQLNAKLSLQGQAERDQLAFILGSVTDEESELLAELGRDLGRPLAAVAVAGPEARPSALERLEGLLSELEEAAFISIEARDRSAPIPSDALFLVVVGSEEEAPFDVVGLLVGLGGELGGAGLQVLVAEPGSSRWEVVPAIRSDEDARAEVSTVDAADTVIGRIAVIMGLERGNEEPAGHWGNGDGAASVIPQPTPTN